MDSIDLDYTDYILFPDAGAQKRYKGLLKKCDLIPLVAEKVRDFKTGEIIGLEILGAKDLDEARVLILDDLCSAGGSFYYSAMALKEINAGSVYLAITHCENTIHKGKLLSGNEIERIFTTNSILTQGHKKIEILNVIEGE